MRFPRVLAALLLCVSAAAAVPCHHCFNSSNWQQCYPVCDGDFCFVHLDGATGTQGCISGVLGLTPGCWASRNQRGVMCLCDTATCNTPDLLDLLPTTPPTPLSCPEYSLVDDETEFSGECSGHACFYRSETYEQSPGKVLHKESAACQIPAMRPAFYELLNQIGEFILPSSCYSLKDSTNNFLSDCICSEKPDCHMNDSSSHGTEKEMGAIRCRMLAHGTREEQKEEDAECLGQYCLLRRAVVRGIDGFNVKSYRKGCFNVSGSDKYFGIGYRRIGLGTTDEETWFCRSDFCNQDIVHAQMAINTTRNWDSFGIPSFDPTTASDPTELQQLAGIEKHFSTDYLMPTRVFFPSTQATTAFPPTGDAVEPLAPTSRQPKISKNPGWPNPLAETESSTSTAASRTTSCLLAIIFVPLFYAI